MRDCHPPMILCVSAGTFARRHAFDPVTRKLCPRTSLAARRESNLCCTISALQRLMNDCGPIQFAELGAAAAATETLAGNTLSPLYSSLCRRVQCLTKAAMVRLHDTGIQQSVPC